MISMPYTVGTVDGTLMPILTVLSALFSTAARKLTLPAVARAHDSTALARRMYRPPLTIPLQYRVASSVLTLIISPITGTTRYYLYFDRVKAENLYFVPTSENVRRWSPLVTFIRHGRIKIIIARSQFSHPITLFFENHILKIQGLNLQM